MNIMETEIEGYDKIIELICKFFEELSENYSELGSINFDSLIENRLKNNLESVIFDNSMSSGHQGNYTSSEKRIRINPNNTDIASTIIHETLHAISDNENGKMGFKDRFSSNFTGLNEAITQKLTEDIVKREEKNVYELEKSVTSVFEKMASKPNYIKDYLFGTDEVEKEIEQKYGNNMLLYYKKANVLLDKTTVINHNMISINDEVKKSDYKEIKRQFDKQLDEIIEEIMTTEFERAESKEEQAELEGLLFKYMDARDEYGKMNFSQEFMDKFDIDNKYTDWNVEEILKALGEDDDLDSLKDNEENKKINSSKENGVMLKNESENEIKIGLDGELQIQLENFTGDITISEINEQSRHIKEIIIKGKQEEQQEKEDNEETR